MVNGQFRERCEALKEAAKLSLNEIESFDQLSERILTQVVLSSIRTYQQKVAVGIEDSASDLLDTFKSNITKQIFDTAAGWRAVQRDNFLYPRGCRFCFQKGENTIVVIEQDPQVRTLSFMAGMQDDDQDLGHLDRERSERVTLSIPYTLFVFSFRGDRFLDVRCYWRTAPLKNINDFVHCCLLPNIHVGGRVCLGSVSSITGDIADICESLITQFWTSQFNLDLADEWWGKARLAPIVSTGRAWQEMSRTNPLLILNIPFRVFKPLKEVIEQAATGEEPSESSFRHKVSTDIDSCVQQLFHKITAYLKKTKFDKHSPKDIKDSLRDHLRTSVFELIDVVMSLNHEVNKLTVESEADTRPIKQAGILWNSRE